MIENFPDELKAIWQACLHLNQKLVVVQVKIETLSITPPKLLFLELLVTVVPPPPFLLSWRVPGLLSSFPFWSRGRGRKYLHLQAWMSLRSWARERWGFALADTGTCAFVWVSVSTGRESEGLTVSGSKCLRTRSRSDEVRSSSTLRQR